MPDTIDRINLGGGPNFNHPGWLNMEEVVGAGNAHSTVLDGKTVFPFPDHVIKLVYTSHTFEHLDDATVSRSLVEALRCLEPGGDLVIKIPDFEATQRAWRNSDATFLSHQNWNYDAVTWSWASKGLRDTLTNRASLIFSGYWNNEFGSPFAGIINRTPTAYFGPAVFEEHELEKILSLPSPKEITRILSNRIRSSETGFTFTHQNAWSRQEMTQVLRSHGFDCVEQDKEAICSEFSTIPGIREMFDVSLYMHAKPARRGWLQRVPLLRRMFPGSSSSH